MHREGWFSKLTTSQSLVIKFGYILLPTSAYIKIAVKISGRETKAEKAEPTTPKHLIGL